MPEHLVSCDELPVDGHVIVRDSASPTGWRGEPAGEAGPHSHPQSDVTGLAAALGAKQDASALGQAGGYASLGGDGKVPAAQLPEGGGHGGVALIDFGPFPGTSHASIAVTGQSSIAAGSAVVASVQAMASADHSADEHVLESIGVRAGNVVEGVGFTIYGINTAPATARDATRISGAFNVAWSWA